MRNEIGTKTISWAEPVPENPHKLARRCGKANRQALLCAAAICVNGQGKWKCERQRNLGCTKRIRGGELSEFLRNIAKEMRNEIKAVNR